MHAPIRMNGHERTVYSTLSCVCNLFFLIMYNFVSSLVDDVLILPGADSTPVDNGPYFFDVGSWLVNLPTMVSLSDWRESFLFISFVPAWLFHLVSVSFNKVLQKQFTTKVCILV